MQCEHANDWKRETARPRAVGRRNLRCKERRRHENVSDWSTMLLLEEKGRWEIDLLLDERLKVKRVLRKRLKIGSWKVILRSVGFWLDELRCHCAPKFLQLFLGYDDGFLCLVNNEYDLYKYEFFFFISQFLLLTKIIHFKLELINFYCFSKTRVWT